MESQSLHLTITKEAPHDLETEIAQAESLLAERKSVLVKLQEEFHTFTARYTQIIGSLLAEQTEIEREIREAEARMLGLDDEALSEEESAAEDDAIHASSAIPVKTSLRKLFWSVARMFHPDHTTDEDEAKRRHSIMAEASRAYQEGDIDSLHSLLGDEQLQSYCASGHDEAEDAMSRLLRLKEELRTVEFGIKRIKQNGLYRIKLQVDEEALAGRDILSEQAESLKRKIAKARRKLEHFS